VKTTLEREMITYHYRVKWGYGNCLISVSVPTGRTDKAWSEVIRILNAREKANPGCGITRVTSIELENSCVPCDRSRD
jgi:hypothetical protein